MNWDFILGILLGGLGGLGLSIATEFGKDIYAHYLRPKRFSEIAEKEVNNGWLQEVRRENVECDRYEFHWVPEGNVAEWKLKGWRYFQAPDDTNYCYKIHSAGHKEYIMVRGARSFWETSS